MTILQAFTKRSFNQSGLNTDGSLSLDASGTEGRKSTEWFLEPKYYCGVESTTRYRKGNSKSAVRALRGDRAIDGNVKAVAGRKGGYQAAHNRKRVKAEQQQEAARQRNRLQRCGPPYCLDEEGHYNPECPPPLPPNTSSPFHTQAPVGLDRVAGMPPNQRSHLTPSYFPSPDLGSAHDQYRNGLSSDYDHAEEPTTPPGSVHDTPVDDLSFGTKYHPYPHGFINSPEGYGYPPAPAVMSPAVFTQQQGYTLGQVTGICEPPAGIEPPPLFVHGNNLTAEDAATMFAVHARWANAGPYCG